MTTKALDLVAVRELALVSINDESFYNSVKALFPTLFNHYVSQKWDKQKAEKAIYNVVTTWTKSNKGFFLLGWEPTKSTRLAASSEIFDHYEEELTEFIQTNIGQERLYVDVCNYAHDVNGNPTAYHYVMGYPRAKRRDQIGYGDGLSGCNAAIEKAVGKKAAKFYVLESAAGSRSEGSKCATFVQIPVTLSEVA